ncbi:treslin isoform X2 [Stegostoma tigrinum]|uniref:treslin isoform X2 n=1 Tax=Stegostoma tigrinum TaxID=3053191 RepID=UPI0028708EED|nr:treslin isoform X2 [Stegostoma tigrinum]
MASHNIAFLVDTAAEPGPVRQAALRVLLHSGCGSGLHNVRWAFKLFNSAAARARTRGGSRGHGFRELRLRHLEELEEALSREAAASRDRGPAVASATQTALIEALSDYQWDQPDITSPAKSRPGSGTEAPPPRARSSLFLFVPCPHSRDELLGFLQLPASHNCQQLAEKIIPASVRTLLSSHSIAFHWVDTQCLHQFTGTSDHIGYKRVSEVMRSVGGSLIPFTALMQLAINDSALLLGKMSQVGQKKIVFDKDGVDKKEFVKLRETVAALFPFDCSMNYFVNIESFYRKMFPLQIGLLTITQGEQVMCCPVTLEPVSSCQKNVTAPVNIIVKGAVKDWDRQRTNQFLTHAWILQCAQQKETKDNYFLQRLLEQMTCSNIYLVVDVEINNYLPPYTGLLSPLLRGTAVLTLFCCEQEPEFEELLLQAEIIESNQTMSSEVPDAVNRALTLASNSAEDLPSSEVTVPDWVQLELAQTSQQRISFVEGWFPLSELSGASSTLMESFRSMHGVDEKANLDYETSLTNQLAEFYQKKSADEAGPIVEQGLKRRRCGPRTPVRQRMRSMSRSLQMLNVARLNLKAQKNQPDGMQLSIGDDPAHQPKKHLGSKQKAKRMKKITVDFKTEEEMMSSLKENYEKHVADELSQFSFVQNAVSVIKIYLKSANTNVHETACINLIQMQLLKSTKSIRQQYGNQENKELKIRDCQLQVLLRLEMFQQFPSLQSDREQLERLVEEMTNLLRIISLTKDTTFLATFLEEEILNTYLFTVPKILGELYFGLGQNVPAQLAAVLPADFLSDESLSQKTESPDVLVASEANFGGCEGEQLEELRTRSSRKRRSLPLTRHRSVSEISHNLRQIQIPKKSAKLQENLQPHLPIAAEHPILPSLPSQKEVQEVTKVRRNLFNREKLSPKKKLKMPKSYSESVVEGSSNLHNKEKTRHRKLLTKKVTETPLHKQVSHRLLDKQIRGRCSETGSDVSIVKESPERALSADCILRRSPRIKKAALAKSHSSSFYSGSCPMSRSLERVQSLSHIQAAKTKRADIRNIQSPNRLLFGAVLGHVRPKEKQSSKGYCSDSESLSAFQPPKPTPEKLPRSPDKSRIIQKSPLTSCYLTPKKDVNISKTPTRSRTINCKSKKSSPWNIVLNSRFQSPRRSERLSKETTNKSKSTWKMEVQSPFNSSLSLSSPNKDYLPVKSSSRRSERLMSPCRNSSTTDVSPAPSKTLELASQVKTPRKCLSLLNSPDKVSRKRSLSYSINSLVKDESSIPYTPHKGKLKRSKSDDSFISHAPVKCSVTSPAKVSKRIANTSCSSDQAISQKSDWSPSSTQRSTWEVSFQMPPKSSVVTRSMHNMFTPDRLNAMQPKSPIRTGVGFPVTSSKSKMKTPPNCAATPPQSLVRTQSVFCETPLKSKLKTPRKYTASPPRSPVRTRSMISVTPIKLELTDQPESHITPPHLRSSRKRTLLNVAYSSIDQKTFKYNSTPPKSPIAIQSAPASSSTSTHRKTPIKYVLSITPSKHELNTMSNSGSMLFASLKPVSTSESMEIPGNLATSMTRLDQILKTPVKGKNTVCNAQSKTRKTLKTVGKSKLEGISVLQESNLCESIPQIKFEIYDSNESSVSSQILSNSWFAATCDNLEKDCLNAVVGLNTSNSLLCSSQNTVSDQDSSVSLINERLSSSLARTTDAGAADSQVEESKDISQVRLLQSESSALKMKFAVLRKGSDSSVANSVVSKKIPLLQTQSASYEFRWTPDRRQRLAAARQQVPDFARKISTPKGQNWPPLPTYEVELEMQDSGLPKLRFKRTNSSTMMSPQLEQSVTKSNESPSSVCVKKDGSESPLSERNAQRCVKHSGRIDGGHISPSFCFHYSHNTPAKATPRKGGVQTFICQSYTPSQWSCDAASPSRADLGLVPWTPSPKHKARPSQTPDAIKNWPRKKKAATTPLSAKQQKGATTAVQNDNFCTDHYSNKIVPLEEIGMEGVCRLQDNSPTIEWDQRFPNSPKEKFGLRSRKRGHDLICTPLEEGREPKRPREANFTTAFSDPEFALEGVQKEQSSPRAFSRFCNTFMHHRSVEEGMIFDTPAATSPSCKVKSTLSASSLLALTQSPLLYTGRTPAKKKSGTKDATHEDLLTDNSPSQRMAIVGDTDQDHSPFAKAPVRRCITKTYSRKKLVS